MIKNSFIISLLALFVCLSGSTLYASQADEVFNANKESLVDTIKFLKKFSKQRPGEKLFEMAAEAPLVIELGEQTLKNLNEGISQGFNQYEKENEEAKKLQLRMKVSFLESYIKKGKKKIPEIKKKLLKSIKKDVKWLGSSSAKMKYATKTMDKIKSSFATLDKIVKGDPEVAEAEKEQLAQAEKSYKKLMGKVAANVMPKAKYKKGDRLSTEEQIAKAYKARYAKAKVKRVVITNSKWSEKVVASYNNQNIVLVKYSYISASVAVDNGNSCTVYSGTYRKLKSGGELTLYSIGGNYPVLTKNIDK